MNCTEKVREIMKENGIFIFQGEENEELEIDSLRFISIIVQIEEEFGINVADEYLLLEYKSLNDYVKLIELLI